MKVLMINGSPNEKGCTFTALSEVAKSLEEERIASEIVQVGKNPARDCVACMACRREGFGLKCVFDDDVVNDIIEKAAAADGFILGSPVYYAHPSGKILSMLNRMFFVGSENFVGKPGAAVVSARRGGTAAALDVLNKYFGITQMPIVSSTYWNMVYGMTAEEVRRDEEGMQTMRTLGKNMAWLLKCIEAGRKNGLKRPTF